MELRATTCYRALRARDARFDGRFFTAVRTTGVYCRPVCPAPPPKLENCVFLPTAAAAQAAGFRPCLRCRPESSPGTPAWLGSSASVSRALRLIDAGALDEGSVDALAARVGLGERQLRRLFLRHLGASPLTVAQTRRILFAKKLIDETRLPMSQVALASGFASVRRFNAAIRATYGRSPRSLRSERGVAASGSELQLELGYRPPLDWLGLRAYFALRATPGVETVTAAGYARTFALAGAIGTVEVEPRSDRHALRVRIHGAAGAPLIDAVERLRRVFDLGADPAPIARRLSRDPVLRPLVRRHAGARVPGAWDRFELCVRAILGQQVSVRGATTLAGRLARRFGEPLPPALRRDGLECTFPTAEVLVDAPIEEIGVPRARAAAMRSLARACCEGTVDLDAPRDLANAVEILTALPGIGAWTAHYIALRALGEPDAFPSGDLGLRRAFAAPGEKPVSARALEARAEAWRPWRGYAALLIWCHFPVSAPAASPRIGASR